MNWKDFIKTHQQKIVLSVGYLLVATLAFDLGRVTAVKSTAPEVKVEQAAVLQTNYTPTVAGVQLPDPAVKTPSSTANCEGKIKGSSSLIYHLPGGAFYTKTTHPIRCFNTEAEAKAAGFRKSSR